jgi:hypothetical protein
VEVFHSPAAMELYTFKATDYDAASAFQPWREKYAGQLMCTKMTFKGLVQFGHVTPYELKLQTDFMML